MTTSGKKIKAYIHEVFYSIQGEGLWAGRLQHFVRFKGCNVGCRYCDTPETCFVSEDDFRKGHRLLGEPVTVDGILETLELQAAQQPGIHSFSLTGGEPLIQIDLLEELIPRLKERWPEQPVMLETAGLHHEAVGRVIESLDLISMDFKLPSTSGLHGTRSQHERFMAVMGDTSYYVKTIVDPRTPLREVHEAARAVAEHGKSTPFFLQPVTREGHVWGGRYLIDLFGVAREILDDVRVLPQIHKILSLS